MPLQIKLIHSEEGTRVLPWKERRLPTIQDLTQLCHDSFGYNAFVLSYRDEDGDPIRVTRDEELSAYFPFVKGDKLVFEVSYASAPGQQAGGSQPREAGTPLSCLAPTCPSVAESQCALQLWF